MDKKYQVFVSSTYEDLKGERQRVIQAILSVGHIAVGMEFFPAADDDSWDVIKRTIDQCDYYIVLVAGKYGSVTREGISYTQKEFEYADERGVPILAFLHAEPDALPVNMSELEPRTRDKLEQFRALCQNRHCQMWTDASQLPANVIAGLLQLIQQKPRTGWVRADQIPTEATANQVLMLKEKLDRAQTELNQLRAESASWKSDLSQGSDEFVIQGKVTFTVHTQPTGRISYPRNDVTIRLTWDSAFAAVGPFLIASISSQQVLDYLTNYIVEKEQHQFNPSGYRTFRLSLSTDDVQTMLVQFLSLEYVERCARPDTQPEGEVHWRLTPIGDSHLARIKAVRRKAT